MQYTSTKLPTKKTTFFLFFLLSSMVFVPSLTVIFLLGMLPTFLAYILDEDAKKSLFVSVMMPNLSGIILVAGSTYQHYAIWGPIIPEIYQVNNWLIIYGSALLGVLLYWFVPELFIVTYKKTLQSKINFLIEKREMLSERYGDAVKPNCITHQEENADL